MGHVIDLTNLRAITNDVYWPLYGDKRRYNVLVGGAGSGKSVFTATNFAVRLMSEGPGHQMGAFRKVGDKVMLSVFAEFKAALSRLGVAPLWKTNLTERSFTFLPNSNRLVCMGLDDQEKLKSISLLTSAWVEEATEFVPADINQIDLRMRGESPGHKQITLTFNPISVKHWLKKRFFDTPQNGLTRRLHTTFRNNRFLDPQYVTILEDMARRDPIYGTVYRDGQWGVLKGAIYAPFKQGLWPASFDSTAYGLDFGFNHPMVLIKGQFKDRVSYLTEMFYESGKTTADLIAFMRGADSIKPVVPYTAAIYADSEAPDKIEEIRRAGWRGIVGVPKPKGSVQSGIDHCRSLEIWTREGNVNLNAENATYCWREDKFGNPLDEPKKENDHAMDAMRYMLMNHLKPKAGRVTEGAFAGVGVFEG